FDNRGPQELPDIANGGITPRGEVFEENGRQREQQSEQDGNDEKQARHRARDESREQADDREDVAGELDHGADGLEQHEIWKSHQADDAVAWIAEHRSMPPEALDRAALPPV